MNKPPNKSEVQGRIKILKNLTIDGISFFEGEILEARVCKTHERIQYAEVTKKIDGIDRTTWLYAAMDEFEQVK